MANPKLVLGLGIILGLTVAFRPAAVKAQGLPVSGLFPFGDSFYDAGNKRYLTTQWVAATAWPFGKSRDAPVGRWSDGLIVPDFVAQFFKIPNLIPPVLDPKANYSRGTSFAVAGATVLGTPTDTMTLSQQVLKFRAIKKNWTDDYLTKSVFLFNIGTEDYFDFVKKNPTADSSAQQAFVTSVINGISSQLRLLYSLGARKFGFQTLGPLGCYPIVKQENGLAADVCLTILNDLAKQHNAKIRPLLADLAKTLAGFQYNVFNFYEAVMLRFENNLSYRCSFPYDACCGVGTRNAYGCGLPNVHSNLCEYPRQYLFYDGRHFTEKQNEQFGHLFFGANPDIVGPMNLRELLVYPVGLNMLEY